MDNTHAVHGQWQKVQLAMRILIEYEIARGFRYAYVIRTRPDIYIPHSHSWFNNFKV